MSIIDKAIAAVTPPESDAARMEATEKARAAAEPGDWLSAVLEHHDLIREGLADCEAAPAEQRLLALKRLSSVLIGHALAEEIVLYPALAKAHEKGHATMAYTEQTATKMQLAELERLDPFTKEWTDKFKHIKGALLHHIYEEENDWFPELKSKAEDDQERLASRFVEEYRRYVDQGPVRH